MNSGEAKAHYDVAIAEWRYEPTLANALKRDGFKRLWYETVGREVVEASRTNNDSDRPEERPPSAKGR